MARIQGRQGLDLIPEVARSAEASLLPTTPLSSLNKHKSSPLGAGQEMLPGLRGALSQLRPHQTSQRRHDAPSSAHVLCQGCTVGCPAIIGQHAQPTVLQVFAIMCSVGCS
jgi:hypothetical protein